MANVDSPMGLRPIRHRNGAPYNGAANPYYKASGYGTAVFVGDAVIKAGSSNTAEVKLVGAGVHAIGTLPDINRATVGDGNRSGTELDTTSDAPAADASNQLIIARQVNRPDNEPNLIHNKIEVLISNHTEAHGSTAAGDGILGT